MSPVSAKSEEVCRGKNAVCADVPVFTRQGAFNINKLPPHFRFIMKIKNKEIASMMNYNVVYHYGQNRFPGLNISAKTGTAEVGDGKAAHGWFVGFLNDEAHPYAFVCLVENGGSGLGAAGSVINTVLQAAIAK